MNILLDSHILLWTLDGSSQMAEKGRELITDVHNEIYYSAASIWELSIKHQLHPKQIRYPAKMLRELCQQAGFTEVPVLVSHVEAMETLSRPQDAPRHKDPFDKILIAQAKATGMMFLTHDAMLPYYDESCIIKI